jgi:hypothetical protein
MDGSFGKNLEFCTFGTIEPQRVPRPPSRRLDRLDRLASPSLMPRSKMLACGAAKARAVGAYECHALR